MTHALVTLTLNPAIDISGAIDKLVPAHKLRCHAIKREPGGGGINVARVLTRLGAEPLAVFPAGGATGAQLTGMLEHAAVAHRAVPVAAEVRENLVVQEKSGSQYRFVFPGAALTAAEIEAACKTALDAVSPGGWLVASGSLPPGAPPDTYARLARAARAAGLYFALDTSGEALRLAAPAHPALLKVSESELSELSGRPCTSRAACVAAARALLAPGQVIAVTRGDKGALLVSDDMLLEGIAPPILALSTVGAGDSFLAGLVWQLSRGRLAREALRCGVASGCAALLASGTELAQSRDIERLMAQVDLRALSAEDAMV